MGLAHYSCNSNKRIGFLKTATIFPNISIYRQQFRQCFLYCSISDVVCKGLNTKKKFSWYCDDHGIDYISFNFTDISLLLAITFSLQEYQKHTGRNDLGLTIKILKAMATLTRNMMSFKPYVSCEDHRLSENLEALEFFRDWYQRSRLDPR